MKLTAKASGSGTLRLGLWNYRPYNYASGEQIPLSGYASTGINLLRSSDSQPLTLTTEPKVFTCILKPVEGTGLIIPRIYTDKGGKAEVTEFQMELLPPEATKQ